MSNTVHKTHHKHFKFILLFLLLLLISTGLTVNAHSGRTDSNGGHYNHSTSEYHYHHGYPAHQHPNGICPYEFDTSVDSNTFDNVESDSFESENSDKSFFTKLLDNDLVLVLLVFGTIYGIPTALVALKNFIHNKKNR